MIDFHFVEFARLVIAFVLALLPSSAVAAHSSIVTTGDTLDGMTLTTGAGEARPLWVFCASEVDQNLTKASCRVPLVSRLAIGHVFLGREDVFTNTEWTALSWEIRIDDRYINLDTFGTYDYVLPAMAPNPSLVREVFMKFKSWDIVLTNLRPGEHTIEGRVFTDFEEHSWVVDLVIEEQTLTEWASRRGGEKSGRIPIRSRSGCPGPAEPLSPFHGSCRTYV